MNKLFFCLFFLTFSTQIVYAQTLAPAKIERSQGMDDGWHPKLKLGANVSFGSSSDVPGQTDGDTVTLGANIMGGLTLISGQSEWRQSLAYSGTTSRTPTVSQYIKSGDEIRYDTLYFYSLKNISWLGPYAKAHVSTPLFAGRDVQSDTTTYRIQRSGQPTQDVNAISLKLTDGLSPLTTKESVGAFAKFINRKMTHLEGRLGIGAIQVSAGNGLFVDDDVTTTTIIEVSEFQDFDIVGAELALSFTGNWDAKSTYAVLLETLIPFNKDLPAGDNRGLIEMINFDFSVQLSTKIYDWASVLYEYKVKRQPKLVDAYQVQHNLLLTFDYTIL